jgi:hypothetical protein
MQGNTSVPAISDASVLEPGLLTTRNRRNPLGRTVVLVGFNRFSARIGMVQTCADRHLCAIWIVNKTLPERISVSIAAPGGLRRSA